MGYIHKVAGATMVAALAVASLAMTTTGSAAKEKRDDGSLTLAVYGDSPYGTTPTDTRQTDATPAFIDTVNADPDVSGVVHVGDIHSGQQFCTEAYDRTVAQLWTGFDDSVVYTPGDNEWSDCHKTAEGGHVRVNGAPVDYADGNPVANLDLVRSLFFPRAGRTLGNGNLEVQSQARHADPAHPGDSAYVENVMWSRKGVLFVTVNIPGGSNNDADPWYGAAETPAEQAQQAAEVSARTGADLRWLDAAFARAADEDARGVVIVSQADMWDPEKGAGHLTNYEPFVSSVATHTTALGKPVLMFNGDSHVYRSENPLVQGAPCVTEGSAGEVPCPVDDWASHPSYDVPNFHRVVVHGSTFPLEWLKLTVHTKSQAASSTSFGPFSWVRQQQPQLTPAS
jgi:hypothetical protein